mgnify:CR=1 FL=1|jgi:Domain of unknown function (DUF4349)
MQDVSAGKILALVGLACLGLILIAISVPNLLRSRYAADAAVRASNRPVKASLLSVDMEARRSLVEPATESLDRKLIRNCFLNLVVKNPSAIAEKIRVLAEGSGGFLGSSTTSGVDSGAATLTIRVPEPRFEEVHSEIRKLGLRVDSEKLDAQDVTRQYVDQEARLRNLHAEEAQYLSILKRSANVKDTLEVTEKLNAVRGEIEQQQAEFNALSKQVETVALTISLYAESDVQVFGLNWRPLFQLKLSARDGVLALGDYVASITAFLFYLPAILLWVATIVLGAAGAWRLLKWVARVFFGVTKPRVGSEAPASS